MDIDNYIRKIGDMDAKELRQEQESLRKRTELVKLVLSMKHSVKTIAEQEGQPNCDYIADQAKISANDLRYGLLRFSSRSELADRLVRGSNITIRYNDTDYECTVPKLEKHPEQKGRINGMKKIYGSHEEFCEGAVVYVRLYLQEYELRIISIE